MKLRWLAAAASVLTWTTTVLGASAAVLPHRHPLAQHRVRGVPPPTSHAVRSGPHVLYGTIVGLAGSRIAVRLRTGRIVTVDAARAIAGDNYSAPLFIGKTVSVDGGFVGAEFVASHVVRVPSLADLGADR